MLCEYFHVAGRARYLLEDEVGALLGHFLDDRQSFAFIVERRADFPVELVDDLSQFLFAIDLFALHLYI